MSKGKSKTDWWDTLLYVGLFFLIGLFLYQLLKLWQSGTATAGTALQSLAQAAANTIAAVENFLSSLVTSPAAAIAAIFDGVPQFLALLFSFFTTAGIAAGIGSWFGSLFGDLFGSAAPISTSQGAAYTGSPSTSTTPIIGNSDLNSSNFSAGVPQ